MLTIKYGRFAVKRGNGACDSHLFVNWADFVTIYEEKLERWLLNPIDFDSASTDPKNVIQDIILFIVLKAILNRDLSEVLELLHTDLTVAKNRATWRDGPDRYLLEVFAVIRLGASQNIAQVSELFRPVWPEQRLNIEYLKATCHISIHVFVQSLVANIGAW